MFSPAYKMRTAIHSSISPKKVFKSSKKVSRKNPLPRSGDQPASRSCPDARHQPQHHQGTEIRNRDRRSFHPPSRPPHGSPSRFRILRRSHAALHFFQRRELPSIRRPPHDQRRRHSSV